MKSSHLVRAVGVITASLVFTCTVLAASSSGPALAGVTKHKAKLAAVGPDAEGLSKVSFTCSPTSTGPTGGAGTWSVKLVGVQVIESDGVTEWPTPLDVTVFVGNNPTTELHSVHLSQNATTGLFGATASGTLQNPANCASGQSVTVYGSDGWAGWWASSMT
jgi:hypothetical protein